LGLPVVLAAFAGAAGAGGFGAPACACAVAAAAVAGRIAVPLASPPLALPLPADPGLSAAPFDAAGKLAAAGGRFAGMIGPFDPAGAASGAGKLAGSGLPRLIAS
jgi:hypothetical protein